MEVIEKQNVSKNKLSKNEKYLIANDLIYKITALFAETFLVAYFLKVTNENIVQIAAYYIIVQAIKGIGSILIGNFIKNKPRVRIKILSVGVIINMKEYIKELRKSENSKLKSYYKSNLLYGIIENPMSKLVTIIIL